MPFRVPPGSALARLFNIPGQLNGAQKWVPHVGPLILLVVFGPRLAFWLPLSGALFSPGLAGR